MKNIHWLACLSLALGVSVGIGPALAQRDEMPPGYPQSLEADLHSLLNRLREGKPLPELLVRLSSTYFDLADDLLTDDNKRREAYLAGAKAAEQAFNLNENNADAHFFHAINLGSAERLRGIANAALVVKEMKRCAMRAIELNPQHAQALQLMGALSMELPWILGGDEKKAQEYLERAIAADGNYTKARILVARLYKKQGRINEAITQLEAVIHADRPHYRYAWERQYKQEAELLLHELRHP
ncbi:MAG: tetratricopeptide repeat protein [Nitrospira sp.]|nr:tetratricopeptide repeat protein [Nitrospira sp.]